MALPTYIIAVPCATPEPLTSEQKDELLAILPALETDGPHAPPGRRH
jgi:hypothetical protein